MIAIQFVVFYGILAIIGGFLAFCMFVVFMKALRKISVSMELNNWNDKNLINCLILRSTTYFFFNPLVDFDGKKVGHEHRTDFVYTVEERFDSSVYDFFGLIGWVLFLIVAFIWAGSGVKEYYRMIAGGM